MKTKTVLIFGGVILAGGVLYWAFTRDTTTTGGGVHVPAGTRESYGKERGILVGIGEMFKGIASGTSEMINAWRSTSPEGVDDGTDYSGDYMGPRPAGEGW